jgi:hypothetical protein
MRELAAAHPDEAMILHELKARCDASVHRAGLAPVWDERRNTSLVRQTYTYRELVQDGGLEQPVEPVDDGQIELL